MATETTKHTASRPDVAGEAPTRRALRWLFCLSVPLAGVAIALAATHHYNEVVYARSEVIPSYEEYRNRQTPVLRAEFLLWSWENPNAQFTAFQGKVQKICSRPRLAVKRLTDWERHQYEALWSNSKSQVPPSCNMNAIFADFDWRARRQEREKERKYLSGLSRPDARAYLLPTVDEYESMVKESRRPTHWIANLLGLADDPGPSHRFSYFWKLRKLGEFPEIALDLLSEQERSEYLSFVASTDARIPSALDLRILFPDINWDHVVQEELRGDGDGIHLRNEGGCFLFGKDEALALFFHQRSKHEYYRKQREQRNSGGGVLYLVDSPLCVSIEGRLPSGETFRYGHQFGNIRYQIDFKEITDYAYDLPNDIAPADAERKIRDRIENDWFKSHNWVESVPKEQQERLHESALAIESKSTFMKIVESEELEAAIDGLVELAPLDKPGLADDIIGLYCLFTYATKLAPGIVADSLNEGTGLPILPPISAVGRAYEGEVRAYLQKKNAFQEIEDLIKEK